MKYLGIILITLIVMGCGKDKDEQKPIDDQLIQDYISENNLSPISTDSGLYIVIDNEGTVEKPSEDSEITICYTGNFLDGSEFETTYDIDGTTCINPLTISLLNVIDGWQEGVRFFGEGGMGQLIVPSHLAYCDEQVGPIPPNSVIVFNIHLISF